MFHGVRLGRRDLFDASLAAVLLTAGLVDLTTGWLGGSYPHSHWAHVPFIVATTLPIALRRRAPLTTLIAVAAPQTIWIFALFPVAQQPPFLPIVPLVIAVYGAGSYTDGRVAAGAWCVVAIGVATDVPTLWAGKPLSDVVSPNVLLLLTFVVGRGFARLRRRSEEQAAALALAEQDRAQAVARAADAERARIARELHDVISHDVSMMVLQASVERRVRSAGPASADQTDQTDQTLANIESTGREALSELRRMLGVLHKDTTEPATPLRPQPGLAQLPDLIDQARTAGLRVRLAIEGQPVDVPPGLDIAAYRIVQESLTNVTKHACGAAVVATVRYGDGALEIDVTDEGAADPAQAPVPAGGGHGLVGMRERVALFGGTLHADHAPGGGFRVRVRLPLPA